MATVPNFMSLMQSLIEAPSVSSTSSRLDMGNRNVIDLLANWLENLGFNCEILPLKNAPHKANLIATLGSGPGGLVLSGHTDTVPFDESLWDVNPLKVTEQQNKLLGLGSTDMKGFFAVAIEAIRDFKEADFKQPLIILATADEESSMNGARELVEAGRPKARYAMIGEPTGLKPIRMHKGIMMESIEIIGKSGHSSIPSLGINAMEVMHEIISELLAFRKTLQQNNNNAAFDVSVPTMNLGCIHGGDNPNRICERCELHYDIRMLPGMDNEAVREEIKARVTPIAESFGAKIAFKPLIHGVNAYSEKADSQLVSAVEKLTGHTASSVSFATEAPFLQQLGLETVVLGPGNIDQAHQPNEYLPLNQVQPAIDIIQSLIRQFCL